MNSVPSHKTSRYTSVHRGITDIIGTLMLVSATVAGSMMLVYFMNDAFLTGNLETASSLETSTKSLQLLAYDARDSTTLLQISGLDNNLDQKLCGISCNSQINRIPDNGGTEFIILQFKNNSIDSVFLDKVLLNNVEHVWDSNTSGVVLDTTEDDNGGKYPIDGKFSIMRSSSLIQNVNNEIKNGDIVNVLIKLGSQEQDILLNKGIRVLLNIGTVHPQEFLIESGGVR